MPCRDKYNAQNHRKITVRNLTTIHENLKLTEVYI